MLTAQQKASELFDLLLERERLENKLTELNKKSNRLCAELTDAMLEEDCGLLEIGGLQFKLKDDVTFSMQNTVADKWADCPEFLSYLKSKGDEGIVKNVPTIHPQTLKAYLKNKWENKEELPDVVKVTPLTLVNWNKSQVSRMVK